VRTKRNLECKPKDFERMATVLRAQATQYPDYCDESAELARFPLCGNFVVSCLPSRPAIEALANRLQRGATKYDNHKRKARQ